MSGISLPGDADQPTRDVWFGPYCLKPARRQLAVGDRPLPLGGRALDLLIALVERAGEVVSRRELMARVWPDVIVEEANLRVHLSALRKALGDGTGGARYITNVPGRGYSFVAPVQRSAPARGPTKAEPAPLPGRGLPPRLERMVGRDQAVTELCELLRSTRFVSIVASGGMGKTTVAIAAAHALAPEFSNDCCFVDLAAVGEGALVPVTVASALGCYGQGENPLPGLLAFLAGRRLLLILDNCEHVIDAIAPLAENVFKNADQVHLLTTSREALRVDGENVHLLAPLEFPEDDKDLRASTALSSPAIQLFMERAAASGHRLTVDDADARTVAQICRRLDGIALAIELAAGRVGSHGIAGTADLLDNRFKLLWHGRRSALPRHQTLEAMLDWSYNLLAEFERSVLRRLSVFVGVFSLDDALAVVADNPGNEALVADAIESLVDKSLLSTSSAGGTAYRLLDTTRAYGAGKLRAVGEQDAFARRHAQHYANLLGQEGVRATAFGTHRVAAYASMMGNIRAGLAWSFSVSGDQAIGISLAASAAPLLLGLSLLSECERWCDLAIKLLPASGRDSPRELDLLVPLAISSMFTRGNTEAVRAGIERGLALADSLGDRQRQMDLLAGLNIFLTRIADFAGAVRSAERSALVAAEAGDPAAEIMAEWMVGVSHHLAGNQTKAQHHCERGFELASSLGELDIDFFGYDHRVRALVALARALWLRGMPRRALQAAQQALDEAGRRDHPVNVCIALIYTTPVFLWLGDFDRAEQCIERLLVHSEKHSLRPYNAVGTALKGELLTLQGDAHTGVRLLRSALATLQAERHHILATVFARALAESLARLGEFDEALSIINKAVERADPSATFDLPDLLRARGEILLAASPENRSAAEASLVRALEIGQAQSAVGWQLRAAVPLARLWLDDGTPERGRALLTELVERFNKERDTPDVVEARNVLESLQT